VTTPRLAILTTHPIQYHTPLYRLLARDPRIALKVYFCDDHGLRPSYDTQFGRAIQYDVPLVEGYAHEFLPNLHPRPTPKPSKLLNPGVARLLLGDVCDVLVVHGYNFPSAMLALLGPHGRTKVVLRGESNLLRPRSTPIRLAKNVYLRSLFSRIDHFLAIGSLNAAYYAAYGVPRERISVAPYTVDDSLFASARASNEAERRARRSALGLPPDGLLVLFVGKFIPLKRPLDIVRAVASLPSDCAVSLALAGSGELEAQVRAEIAQLGVEKRVQLLGFKNQSELPQLYGCADVLVLASDTETWGLVVNEAMAAGMVPIVTDRVGCGPDLVEPSCIYPFGDVTALQAILTRMAREPEWFAELRARAEQRIAHWGLPDTARGFVHATYRVLGRGAPAD
jgi:glycosyltransferase involved in cell wall biosynthesis